MPGIDLVYCPCRGTTFLRMCLTFFIVYIFIYRSIVSKIRASLSICLLNRPMFLHKAFFSTEQFFSEL